jgi:hypothetical protein
VVWRQLAKFLVCAFVARELAPAGLRSDPVLTRKMVLRRLRHRAGASSLATKDRERLMDIDPPQYDA